MPDTLVDCSQNRSTWRVGRTYSSNKSPSGQRRRTGSVQPGVGHKLGEDTNRQLFDQSHAAGKSTVLWRVKLVRTVVRRQPDLPSLPPSPPIAIPRHHDEPAGQLQDGRAVLDRRACVPHDRSRPCPSRAGAFRPSRAEPSARPCPVPGVQQPSLKLGAQTVERSRPDLDPRQRTAIPRRRLSRRAVLASSQIAVTRRLVEWHAPALQHPRVARPRPGREQLFA